MNPILLGVAFAVSAGAVVAVSAREARVALVGLAVALTAAPFLADPLPALPTLAMRVVGAALAASLLRTAVNVPRTSPDPRRPAEGHGGSQTGWPTETLLAIGGWIVGVSLSLNLESLGPGGPAVGADLFGMLNAGSIATGVGLAAIVISIVPALRGRDGFRTSVGLLILAQGLLVLRAGVGEVPAELEQLADVALLIAAALAGSILILLGMPGEADLSIGTG